MELKEAPVTKTDRSLAVHRGSEGFALILAMLSLLLLTVLGLTLAATTTTEVQIASNFKWSQQAQQNAEAGVEVAKRVLRDFEWASVMPTARAGSWVLGAGTKPTWTVAGATRDFENAECDRRGGQGYGVVLNNGTQVYENVTTIPSPIFNVTGVDTRIIGAFSVWTKRMLVTNQDGTFSDSTKADEMIITVEGTAPYTAPNTAFTAVNRAVRTVEVKMSRVPLDPCGNRGGQQGSAQAGAGFATCLALDDLEAIAATGAAGGAGGGTGAGISTAR